MKYNLLGAASTIALGAACGIAFMSPASAALQTQSWSFGPSLQGTTLDQFNQFSTPGQTLIDVIATFTVNKLAVFDNAGLKSGTSGAVTAMTGTGFVGLKQPEPFGLALVGTSLSTPNFTGTITSSKTVGSATLSPVPVIVSQTFSTLAQLSAFEGAGKLNITIQASNTQGGSVPANVLTGVSGSATGTLSLSFTSVDTPPPPSPTPEPASLALLGAGLAGLGAIRRRRKL